MRGALLAVSLVACAQHTTFPAPPPNLTPEQRVDMFNKHVAEPEHWILRNGSVTEHSVIIQDGGEVAYPEDLIPLVGDDSATAEHARTAAHARHAELGWEVGSSVLLTVGGYLVITAAYANPGDTVTMLGLGAVIAGLVAGAGATYYYFQTVSETNAAYETYDDDLARRLNICVAALKIVPCETLPRPASAAR